MKKIKKKFRSFISFFLAVCMIVSILPSGVLASETDGTEIPSEPVIEGFEGYDGYGSDPYLTINDYTSESQLPATVKVNLSDGNSVDLAITWERVAEDNGSCEFDVQLPDDYRLSETLETEVLNGHIRLPWILAILPTETSLDTAEVFAESESEPVIESTSETQTTAESIPESETDPAETQSDSAQETEPAVTESKDAAEDTENLEENSVSVIVDFGSTEASVTIPKGTLDEALADLPSTMQVTLKDGKIVDIPASWKCTDDYENTEYDLYTFLFELPEGYVLSDDLTEEDLPYYEVNISGMDSKEGRHSWTANPNGTITIDKALGATQDIVAYLEANANLYLGTPYSDDFDDPSASGVPGVGMNCTGFVGHVLMACGADLTPIVETDMPAYLAKAWTNLSCWEWWLDNNPDVISYRFNSTAEALASGILEKGDIVIYEPDVSVWNAGHDAYGNKADCHIGFFWGDNSHDNKFWHSSHGTVGIEGSDRIVYAGTNPGNQISQLAPKCVSYCYVVKTTHPTSGYLQLQKSSANLDITNGNGCYSLEGAVYGVYTDPQCTEEKLVATLTTDVNGKSQTIELDAGTYYVKETQASPGYAIDTKTYTVNVTSSHTSDAPVIVQSVETPLNDPLAITLAKIDAESGSAVTQGAASLAGAQFTINYYDGYYTKETLPNTPTRTWVIQTLEQRTSSGEPVYYARLLDTYKVSGNDFYYMNGTVTLPLGTITVQETKAPEGYTLENSYLQPATGGDRVTGLYVAQIKDYGSTARLDGGNEYIVADYAGRGGVSIQKVDADTGDDASQGNASLSGAVYAIINQNEGAVIVNGHSYAKGEEVLRLTTDASGKAQTAANVLPFGEYSIVEVDPSNGYLVNSTAKNFTISQADTIMALGYDLPEDVIRGGVKIQKRDAETSNTTGQGNASLSGAEFSIINLSKNPVYVNGKLYGNGKTVAVITTNENGLAQTSADLLPYGTYRITETKPPVGYTGEGTITREFTITKDGEIVDLTDREHSIMNEVIRGGVKIQKRDAETSDTTGQGNASLSGAEFSIINLSKNPVYVNGKLYGNGETVAVITTNENGLAQTSADLLPYGTYRITETKPPVGYTGEGTITREFTITKDGEIVDLTDKDHSILNEVIRGGVKIQKRDIQSGDGIAQGGANLEGAVFEITNMSSGSVIVDGKAYASGEVVAKITTNKDGIAQTASDLLPFGLYKITEVTPPKGYLGEGILERTFIVVQDGVVIDMTGEDQAIYNQVIRGDFELTKIDSDTQNAMAGIPFRITSNTTGESHTFTTDANGFYSSSSDWNPHSQNTNGGGPEDGLWFGLDGDGNLVEVNDDLGALPFDTYTIEELRCEANEDKILYTGTLTISRDGYTIDMGNIENDTVNTPAIYTSARNEDTGTAYGIAQAGTVIIDTVTYTGLTPGENYTLTGTLMDKTTGMPMLDNEGNAVTGTKIFKAVLENGTAEVEFIFDASGLAGADVVVFEKLYYEDEEIASHEDLADEGQTIHFPGIHTTAKDSTTGINIGAPVEQVTIVDTVSYTNLQIGRSYTLTGTLMDKTTGTPLRQGGREITTVKTFIPKTSNGTVDVEFSLDASLLAGKSVVVFETLSRGMVTYAVHEDIDDEGQTVHFPEIGTTAVDGESGKHMGNASEKDVTIIDTVAYKNLIPGKEYTVTGTLMDKASGEPLTYDGQTYTAEITFTPEKADGSIDLTFTVPGAALLGKIVVAFETVSYEAIEIGSHTDINDENQTVYYPEIGTTATDQVTGTHYALAEGKVTIQDIVDYAALIPGKTYVMTGTLMNVSDGEPVMNGEEPVSATKEFTPETSDGSLEMTFTFDASALAGGDVVVFESLTLDGAAIAAHEDIEDEGQTIHFPKIGTTALDSDTNDHISNADDQVTLTDTVPYRNLEPGTEYTLTGTLMDKVTGEALVIGGQIITSEIIFTPEKTDGTVEVTFTFDGSDLAGKDLVVFEELSMDSHLMATHKDLEDEGQTIHFLEIQTTATDDVTGDHVGNADVEEVTITDVVAYKNLIPGKEYTVTGTLMDKATGEPLTYDGQTYTAEITFTPEKADGSIDLTFTVPGAALLGKTVVAFETMSYEGIEIGSHTDIEDENQTVYYPEIGTTAKDSVSGTHQGYEDETVTIIDTVEYTNLAPGKEYTVTGVLMDKATGEPYLVDNKEVTAQATFIPETANGSVELTFTFNGNGLTGHTLVAFETVYYKDFEVAAHTDLEDGGQTVDYPEIYIGTTATDQLTGTHQGFARENTVIVDEVVYKGTEPGQEYTMKGILMDKATGEPYLVNGTEITAEKTFTAEGEEGSVTLEFAFDGSDLKDVTLVVFESLYYGNNEVAGHKDLTDEGQTVTYPEITLKTEAKDKENGSHEAKASETVTIIDTVTYAGLIPGREYTMKGILMDKSTGNAFLVNGKEVIAEVTFTPEEANGSIEMSFTFDGSAFDGKTLVVFESLYYEGIEIGTHADLNDAAQTVEIVQPEAPGFHAPQTGIGGSGLILACVAGCLLIAVGITILVISKKRKSKTIE